MSQVQKIEQSKIAKVVEGLGMIREFFSTLVAAENIQASEEVVKQSGIKELINSSERIKNIESMFEDHGTSIKQVKAKLKGQEKNNAPELKSSIIKTNIQDIEKDEEDIER